MADFLTSLDSDTFTRMLWFLHPLALLELWRTCKATQISTKAALLEFCIKGTCVFKSDLKLYGFETAYSRDVDPRYKDSIFRALKTGAMPDLVNLNASYSLYRPEHVASFCGACESGALRKLIRLKLHGGNLSINGGMELFSKTTRLFASLKTLDVGRCVIDDDAMSQLAAVCFEQNCMPLLEEFLASRNEIGNVGLRALCGVFDDGHHWTRLRTLDLECNSISDPRCLTKSFFKNTACLTRLNLDKNAFQAKAFRLLNLRATQMQFLQVGGQFSLNFVRQLPTHTATN